MFEGQREGEETATAGTTAGCTSEGNQMRAKTHGKISHGIPAWFGANRWCPSTYTGLHRYKRLKSQHKSSCWQLKMNRLFTPIWDYTVCTGTAKQESVPLSMETRNV